MSERELPDEPAEERAIEIPEDELDIEEARAAEAGAVDALDAGAPSRGDRSKPVELLAISAACGVFAGLITLLVTRDWLLTGVMFGVAFIIGLVVLAMLSLGGYETQTPPSKDGVLRDNERKQDLGH